MVTAEIGVYRYVWLQLSRLAAVGPGQPPKLWRWIMRLFRIELCFCIFTAMSFCAYGQSIRPAKDLIFAQIAAGGGYETLLTATNRGTAPYSGSLIFYQGASKPWSPTVNGNPITGGTLQISLPAGGTSTWRIGGGSNTESGFAAIVGSDPTLLAVIEGNLTYFVKSGDTILDSVGILPSSEFYLSSVPFEDFLSLALALANRDPKDRQASVTITVYSENNVKTAEHTITLAKNAQYVSFLWQEFGRLALTRGRLEIHSDVAIAGTALMFTQSQFASLPLAPSMRIYRITKLVGATVINEGQATIWADGAKYYGYFVITKANGYDIDPAAEFLAGGILSSGSLKLAFYLPPGFARSSSGAPVTSPLAVFAETMTPFTFDLATVEFQFLATNVSDFSVDSGYFTITMVR
jgi:hypothetical protein